MKKISISFSILGFLKHKSKTILAITYSLERVGVTFARGDTFERGDIFARRHF